MISSGFQSHIMHKVLKQKNIISILTTSKAFFDYETNSPFPKCWLALFVSLSSVGKKILHFGLKIRKKNLVPSASTKWTISFG